ncbi:unnamed protein product [Candida verbasci]|uniref:Uncharacterized protein n=1 Tax=Candida verbasci TaxID=1227364 RepID=A0A9W4TR66_9ASCO|nr:unnamed protein product [Candida verbasci]
MTTIDYFQRPSYLDLSDLYPFRVIKPTTIAVLPYEVIIKILIYRFEFDNQHFHHILPFILTCKTFYNNYIFLIYTLKQLVISLTNKPNSISYIGLETLIKYTSIIRVNTVHIDITPKFRFDKMFLTLIYDSIYTFEFLEDVTLTLSSMEYLFGLLNLHSPRLKRLSIILTSKINYFNRLLDTFEVPIFDKLEKLKFETKYPLSINKVSKYFPNFRSVPDFKWQGVAEKIPFASYESPMFQISMILAKMIYESRETLRILDLKNINPVFIIRELDPWLYRNPRGYQVDGSLIAKSEDDFDSNFFPNLKMIYIDNLYQFNIHILNKLLGDDVEHKDCLFLFENYYLKELKLIKLYHGRLIKKVINTSEYENIEHWNYETLESKFNRNNDSIVL